jgi:Ala-tRNA(Pro) deacylase
MEKTEDIPAKVYAALDALGIAYERYEHPPVFTSEDAEAHWAGIAARGVKNLFLRNKKGNRHYLVVLPVEKEADLRHLVKVIGDDRLSFGSPERLATHLGVTPGSVSPFGLLNDRAHAVQVILDADLRDEKRMIFHPNLNSHSLTISREDLERFLASTGHVPRWLRV